MADGITKNITGVLTLTDKLELTANDDILNITDATITLSAPAGDLFTGAGADVVTVVNSTITATADGLSFFLGSGDDYLSLASSTIDAPIATGTGADTVLITGDAQSVVTLKKRKDVATLSLGDGNDILELAAILSGDGDIDFGTGSDTLRFNGGSLLTTGTITNLNHLVVTTAGGTLGRDLTLTGEAISITLGGNLTGNTAGRGIVVAGGTVTLATASNIRTNVAFTISDTVFAHQSGGTLEISTGVKFTHQSGGTLEISSNSGYVFYATNSTVTLHDLIASDNNGGITGTDTVWVIKDSNFSNNKYSAAKLIGGSLDLTNVDISNQTSISLWLGKTILTGSDVSFSGNWTNAGETSNGGAIYSNADITLTNAKFNGNHASASTYPYPYSTSFIYGGAIYQSGGNSTLTSATFSGNYTFAYAGSSAFAYGGAIYQNDGHLILTSAAFNGNFASAYGLDSVGVSYGGAIYRNGGNSTLTSVAFSDNYAYSSSSSSSIHASSSASCSSYGGAICQNGGSLTLTSATFSGNYAFATGYNAISNGGAIYKSGGNLTLNSATFNANYTSSVSPNSISKGGAICQNGGDLNLTSATFNGNYASAITNRFASSYGGAIYQNGGNLTLTSVTFSGNCASTSSYNGYSYYLYDTYSYGGAIYAVSSIVNIQDTIFVDNRVAAQDTAQGGAIYLAGNSVMTYTVTVGNKLTNTGNSAMEGGFLYMESTASSIFSIASGASLTIGSTSNGTNMDSIEGGGSITKSGAGTMTIHSEVNEYDRAWTVSGGVLHLATIARTVLLDNWTIEAGGVLQLSKMGDTVNITRESRLDGTIDLGDGDNVINAAAKATFGGKLIGGAGNDTIMLSSDATFSDVIDLGGGKNIIGVSGNAVISKGIKMTAGGETRLVIYQGAVLAENTLSVFASESTAMNKVTLDWSSIADLGNVRLVVSRDAMFNTFEFVIELYNQSKSLTLNVENGYYVQFQVQNGDDWLDQELPGTIAPVQFDSNTNLLANGYSQIVAWDAAEGKVGYVATNGQSAPAWAGIWEWGSSEAAMWKVVGVGRFSADVEHHGILLYNGIGNTFAAWTDLGRGDYGYISLCHVDGNFQTLTLADFDGNGLDDVIIYDENGSFGIVSDARTYHDVWHVVNPATNVQKVIGAGYFGRADGKSEILVKNTDNNAYFLWHNEDPTFNTWSWNQTQIGSLDDDWTVAAIGDFQGDGIDDIIMWQKSTGNMYAWEDGKSSNQRWVGALESSQWEVAAVGDYNGDGKEDLLLRELSSGWGGLGYWGAANADNWTDLNARVETDMESKFSIIA